MAVGISFVAALPRDGPVHVGRGHGFLLGQRVDQERHVAAVKEVQDAVIHTAHAAPQLVDAVPQQVRARSSHLVTHRLQPLDRGLALHPRPAVPTVELHQPFEHRHVAGGLLIEDHVGLRDLYLLSVFHDIAMQR